jgi:hypothetical protein
MKKLFLLILFWNFAQSSRATYISVRLVKAQSSKCSEKPKLTFLSKQTVYTIASKQWYNGESNREIFFELETNDKNIPIETIEIEAIGVSIIRAIVGRTDVVFTKKGNRYLFSLVKDSSNGRHVQSAYQNPQGGPFMWIYHNWEERVNGEYLNIPYPTIALKASLNYEVGCQEMLRLMGNMNGINQSFNGEFILLNCESSAPRAHLDFPPHWHLQHWQHGHDKEYGLSWREKQYIIPHYYLDSLGKIIRNKQSITQNNKPVKQSKSDYLIGDTCIWNDAEGHLIFKQIILDDGLHFINGNNEDWLLQIEDGSINNSVLIIKNKELEAKIMVQDDGENGETKIEIYYYDKNKVSSNWKHIIKYDPFTGIAK